MIGGDFEITYVVQRQVSSGGDEMVASTTLAFNATLTQPNLHGDLQLTLIKPDGTAGLSTLTIGGQCQGVLGKSSLQVGFTFTQTFGGAGNQITRTAAFSGTIAFSGGQVQWTFSATGGAIDLAVGVDIKLGPSNWTRGSICRWIAGRRLVSRSCLGSRFNVGSGDHPQPILHAQRNQWQRLHVLARLQAQAPFLSDRRHQDHAFHPREAFSDTNPSAASKRK